MFSQNHHVFLSGSYVHPEVKLKERTVSHHLYSVCLNFVLVEWISHVVKTLLGVFDQLGGS